MKIVQKITVAAVIAAAIFGDGVAGAAAPAHSTPAVATATVNPAGIAAGIVAPQCAVSRVITGVWEQRTEPADFATGVRGSLLTFIRTDDRQPQLIGVFVAPSVARVVGLPGARVEVIEPPAGCGPTLIVFAPAMAGKRSAQ